MCRNLSQIAPFVGVCGVRTAADYNRLVTIADSLPDTNHMVSAGVKDLSGDLHTITPSSKVRTFIHCDYKNTEPYEHTLHNRLTAARDFIFGAQLNLLPWMDMDFAPLLSTLRRWHSHVALMLQAHCDIMTRYSPQKIADRLALLPVDYILFDASQSRGIPYDISVMQAYVTAVYQRAPHVRVVVSGGLGPHNMHTIFAPLARQFPDLSCDAFFHIYDLQHNQLSWRAVEQYLVSWHKAIEPN